MSFFRLLVRAAGVGEQPPGLLGRLMVRPTQLLKENRSDCSDPQWKLSLLQLAEELGVEFRFNESVKEIRVEKGSVKKLVTEKGEFITDAVISGADYQFTESKLLLEKDRSYSEKYWNSKVFAPSCLLYYIGLNKKLENVLHHSLFFDVPFDKHADEIYAHPQVLRKWLLPSSPHRLPV